ncbi:MAG: tetratricopeptide repeat protein [Erythrobacter sp.]|nr:tetratricopeptide repeat protein [Erythrobacter sp.]
MRYGAHQLNAIHHLLTAGDIESARSQIERVVFEEPGNSPAWHLAGVIRRAAGHREAAVEAYREAIGLGLETAEILNSLGLALGELGRHSEASAALEQAMRREPRYVEARINAARLAVVRNDRPEAIRLLQEGLELDPQAPLILNSLGTLYHENGDGDAALQKFDATLACRPDNLFATVKKAGILREIGRSAEALAELQASAHHFPNSPEVAEATAGALVDERQIEAAERVYESIVAKAPGYFAAHRGLARLAMEYGTSRDPYRSYRALTQKWPGENAIWLDWLSLAVAARDFDTVLTLCDEARGRTGGAGQIDFFEAVARSEVGQTDTAETLFQSLYSGKTDDRAFLNAWARNSLRRGEPRQAMALAQRCVEIDATDQFGWAYLSLCWRVLDDPREFWLHDYERQVQQRPLAYLGEKEELEHLKNCLAELHRAVHQPADQSLRKGTQTEGALFMRSDPRLQRLRREIEAHILDYASTLPTDPSHPFYRRKAADVRFVGSWSVRLREAGYHIAHIHPEGWISSALHLQVPQSEKGGGGAGTLMLGVPPQELGLELNPRLEVRPVEGSLVLFPSSMWHGTAPNAEKGTRLAVAFDAIPR